MIEITDLRKEYYQAGRTVAAVDGVSLQVRQGEVFGVLGQSGAGKSTLIRCVNLLERPTSGSVRVDGQELTTLAPPQLRHVRQQIGMIFQHFNLLSSRTVADNVAFPLEVMGYDRQARRTRVHELLALVGLEDKAQAYPSQLSGGQKQRVGIARALAGNPKVLLSDEATSALDPQTTRSILDLLKDLNRRLGLTIMLITHQMGVVKHVCDSVGVMHAGKIIEQGKVIDLMAQPSSVLAREFFPHLDGYKARPNTVLATLTFAGHAADQPILTTLARKFNIDANILGGSIETVNGSRVGQLQVELVGDQIEAALHYARAQGLQIELAQQAAPEYMLAQGDR